jgi:hypothetical protein
MKDWPQKWIYYKTDMDLKISSTERRNRRLGSYQGRCETWRRARIIAKEIQRLGGIGEFERTYSQRKIEPLVREIKDNNAAAAAAINDDE